MSEHVNETPSENSDDAELHETATNDTDDDDAYTENNGIVRNYIDIEKVPDTQLNPAYLKCSDCGAEGASIDRTTHRDNPVYQFDD